MAQSPITDSLANEQAIFEAARALPPGDARQAYLQEACENDAALRQRIHALLAAYDDSEKFLESPLHSLRPTPLTDLPLAEQPGALIGPYKLLEIIGEGGMGIVYRAEQKQPVERTVALKIIKPGLDTRQIIARFEAERQALALMDHPNIAKVLDAGTTGEPEVKRTHGSTNLTSDLRPLTSVSPARPYFVMELVHGIPITKYCDQHHLNVRQRLELMIPVCQAIQHAHQKGIIHRDIKPSNVLVTQYDGHPVPKVIDFGVAKAVQTRTVTEQLTEHTHLGQIIGTLEYMSPEQAELNPRDIDTRSDIYSLGVLLYELLTGVTPFDQQHFREAAFHEMLRIIREDEPPKPSTRLSRVRETHRPQSSHHRGTHSVGRRDVAPSAARINAPRPTTAIHTDTSSNDAHLPPRTSIASIAALRNIEPARLSQTLRGELDWIVMKALEKDRNRRYETATNLAGDLNRYLNDEAVQACPPSALYRFGKFSRRNKAALTTAVLVLLALLAGTAVSTWQAIRATRAETLARANAARAEENERQAKLEAQRALAAAKSEQAAKQAQSREQERADEQTRKAQEQSGLAAEQQQLAERYQRITPLIGGQYAALLSTIPKASRPEVAKILDRISDPRSFQNATELETPQGARKSLLSLFDNYVEENGNSTAARLLVADALAELKEFDQARKHLEADTVSVVESYGSFYRLMLLAADQNDTAAHRRYCSDLIARLDSGAPGVGSSFWLSSSLLACGILPNSLERLGSAIGHARKHLAGLPNSGRRAAALGALLLRAGYNEEAVEVLQAATTTKSDVEGANLYGQYLLAIAHHHCDRPDAAKESLRKAKAIPEGYFNWRFEIIVRLLRREAILLIDPPSPD